MKPQAETASIGSEVTSSEDPILETFLGYNLKRAFNAIHANLTVTLRSFNLRMVTYSALTLVLEREGMRQAELATALKIDRGNAVAIVDELEKRSLVTRDQHPDDRRSYALHITEKGRKLCERAIKADQECEAQILRLIDAKRLDQLISTLREIEASAYIELERRNL